MPLYIAFLAYDAFINSKFQDNSPPNSGSGTTAAAALHPDTNASICTDEQQLIDMAVSILSRWYFAEDSEVEVRISDFVREMYLFDPLSLQLRYLLRIKANHRD
jgi:hypothetical protein